MHKLQQLLNDIDDRLSRNERVVVAVDGMAAAGKSTLASHLKDIYSCNVISMDHFFLRPKQRTSGRLATPGGNIDYERFTEEVIKPLRSGESFFYRPYNCSLQELSAPVVITPKQLTVVEGVYSLRPDFADAYNICVFMRLDEDLQRKRLYERNPEMYERFINEWIPMENKYFEHFKVQNKCNYVFDCS